MTSEKAFEGILEGIEDALNGNFATREEVMEAFLSLEYNEGGDDDT
jgi:predicted transcriptional regulator